MAEIVQPTVTISDIGGQSATITPSLYLTKAVRNEAVGRLREQIEALRECPDDVRKLSYEGLGELLLSLSEAHEAAVILRATTACPDEESA